MENEFPGLDLEASLLRLSEWLRVRHGGAFDFSEDSRRHLGLAARLRAVAAVLDQDEWLYLEERFNLDPPPLIDIDGTKVASPLSNAGRYKALYWHLLELADTADALANENPKPRTKPVLGYAADYFLHLWLEGGSDRPSMYDKGPAVAKLKAVFIKAGVVLSDERVRGVLMKAWDRFDPHYCLDWSQLQALMVFKK